MFSCRDIESPQDFLADVCGILCCASHLELWLCSLCVLEKAGVCVHALSRYCRECIHLMPPRFYCRCHEASLSWGSICPTCRLLQTLVMRALFLLGILWQLVYVWWEALAFIFAQWETRRWKSPGIDISSSCCRHAMCENTAKSFCIITLFWRSYLQKHISTYCQPECSSFVSHS